MRESEGREDGKEWVREGSRIEGKSNVCEG